MALTLGNDPRENAASNSSPQSSGATSHATKAALLVDDDPLMLGFLRIALDKAGWNTHTAETVAAAKDILQADPAITVIISDIQLPAESGFDLANWLNETRGDERHVEVILITGDANDDALISALRCRVFDLLRKPFDVRNLVASADRAYRTACARRDRFQRLAVLDAALKTVREERLEYQARLRQSEAKFEDTHARLAYVNQTMANIVSHELRTPLIPIIGLAEVLESAEELSPGEISELAAEIRKAGESLATIVENALNFIDIERQVRTQPHDLLELPELVRDVVAELSAQTAARAVTVLVACSAQARLRAPRFLLRSAILALLDNAIKASPTGGTVSLAVRAYADETLSIDIRDRGAGLPAHVIDNFGAPFLNGDNSDTRTWPGIGLGIASALRIVQACGGSLEALPMDGNNGTLMRMTLPVAGSSRDGT